MPVVLALAAGAFAIFDVPRAPLKSTRPAAPSSTPDSLVGEQRIPTRLWEDPFGATAGAKIPTNSLDELAAELSLHEDPTILGILVEGSNYAEDRETRLRLRYATQVALLEPGWRPEDRAHIGCFQVPWRPGRELLDSLKTHTIPDLQTWSSSNSLVIPFEWFAHVKNGTKDKSVLVLWLKEEEFGDYPLHRFLQLAAGLNAERLRHSASPATFDIMGPRSSDTLREFAREAVKADRVGELCPEDMDKLRKHLKIYSSIATVPDAFLSANAVKGGASTNRVALIKWLRQSDIDFMNLTPLDTSMAAALAHELRLRDVPPFNGDSSPQPSVAVLYEADSTFSRSLVNCFDAMCKVPYRPASSAGNTEDGPSAMFGPVPNNKDLLESDYTGLITTRRETNPKYVAYAYLRGLDGTRPLNIEKPPDPKPDAAKENTPVATKYNQDQADGNAQFDYARRISQELKENIPDLKAVGIFGSDPYDKLILLQAIREEFPNVICFTKDLDNRYLGPNAGAWARNMVVVSPFPLDYDKMRQSSAAFSGLRYVEFRSSTQTALYCAIIRALYRPVVSPWSERPLLYEVGRSQFISLPDSKPADDLKKYWCSGPGVLGHWEWLIILLPSAAILLIILSPPLQRAWEHLWEASKAKPASWQERVSTLQRARVKAMLWFGIPGLIIIGIFWFLFLCYSERQNGAAFRWTEGVSIWPTEIIRLFAIWLVALMLIYWRYHHRIWRIKLWAEFVEGAKPSDLSDKTHPGTEALKVDENLAQHTFSREFNRMRNKQPGIVGRYLKEICLCRWGPYTSGGGFKIRSRHILQKYLRYGLFWRRMLRVIPQALLFFVLGFCLTHLLGQPGTPSRSGLTLDLWILRAAVLAFCLLTFYVVDASRLTERVIVRLNDAETAWDERYLARLKEETRLEDEDLAGYADVQFVAAYTRDVGNLIYMPFIILFIMLVSRTQYFDRWPWTPGLLIITSLSALIAFLSAFRVRFAAANVRKEALKILEQAKLREQAQPPAPAQSMVAHLMSVFSSRKQPPAGAKPPKESYIALLQSAIDRIKHESAGAYAPWLKDNAVLAGLLTTFGAALLKGLDCLFLLN